jgi:hypothetical protein
VVAFGDLDKSTYLNVKNFQYDKLNLKSVTFFTNLGIYLAKDSDTITTFNQSTNKSFTKVFSSSDCEKSESETESKKTLGENKKKVAS